MTRRCAYGTGSLAAVSGICVIYLIRRGEHICCNLIIIKSRYLIPHRATTFRCDKIPICSWPICVQILVNARICLLFAAFWPATATTWCVPSSIRLRTSLCRPVLTRQCVCGTSQVGTRFTSLLGIKTAFILWTFLFIRILCHFYVGLILLTRYLQAVRSCASLPRESLLSQVVLDAIRLPQLRSSFPSLPRHIHHFNRLLTYSNSLLNTCPWSIRLQPTFLHFLGHFSRSCWPSLYVVERASSVVECRTRNQGGPGSNPPFLPFRRLGIFVLSIDAPVHSAV